MIALHHLSYKIDEKTIIDDLSYTFNDDTFYGLIGPNGTGKSTLIQLITGYLKAASGQVLIHNKPLSKYSNKQLAQTVAVLQQGGIEPLDYTVKQVLEMARYPYQGWLGYENGNTEAIITEAVARTSISSLINKKLNELSGGERQRVALAKLWVQRPSILLLDEPTTYLDIGYQQMVMAFIAEWKKEEQLLVIAVMHDINLAALYCEKIIALDQGRFVAEGNTKEVLTESLLNSLFGANVSVIEHPKLNVPQMILNNVT